MHLSCAQSDYCRDTTYDNQDLISFQQTALLIHQGPLVGAIVFILSNHQPRRLRLNEGAEFIIL